MIYILLKIITIVLFCATYIKIAFDVFKQNIVAGIFSVLIPPLIFVSPLFLYKGMKRAIFFALLIISGVLSNRIIYNEYIQPFINLSDIKKSISTNLKTTCKINSYRNEGSINNYVLACEQENSLNKNPAQKIANELEQNFIKPVISLEETQKLKHGNILTIGMKYQNKYLCYRINLPNEIEAAWLSNTQYTNLCSDLD